jgi:hypothetical protein
MVVRKELNRRIEAAAADLPENLRAVFVLGTLEGMRYCGNCRVFRRSCEDACASGAKTGARSDEAVFGNMRYQINPVRVYNIRYRGKIHELLYL